MLEVRNVFAGYEQGNILKGVSFNLEEGKVLALIGPNGSGKTTLIRTISGVLSLNSGSIRVAGREIKGMPEQEKAKLISVVPQARMLPAAFTAQEVVAMGRTPYLNWLGRISDEDQRIIERSLESVNLMDLAGRSVAELSGGEQQRLLLARALAQETPLLLMDEPTAHLDLQYQVSLMQLIYHMVHPTEEGLNRGVKPKTVVITIHDLNLLTRYADYVGLLVDGELAALDSPGQVLRSDLLSQAYHLKLRVIHDSESGYEVITPDGDPAQL